MYLMPLRCFSFSGLTFKRIGQHIGSLLAVTACLGLLFTASPALAKSKKSKENNKYAAFIMDADTGQILHQSNPDKKLHPASLTKVMTLLMVFEALEQGRLNLNDKVRISKHAAGQAPSKLGIPAGQSIRVQDAIYALVTKSANDIAAALGERLGGTESNFARMMTVRAHELGMNSSNFKNASGLHNPGQITTARDMAKLAQIVINDHPSYYRYFSTQNFKYKGANYHNHNRLMSTYKGMDGMKTGYIGPSGFNLVASAVRGNHRLIGVVFGGRSAASRNAHMAALLDKGFVQVKDVRVASAGGTYVPEMTSPVSFNRAPLPPRKPGLLVAMNTLAENAAQVAPASGLTAADINPSLTASDKAAAPQKWAFTNPAEERLIERMSGEGDYDPAATQRIKTGLIAIAAHKGEAHAYQTAAYHPPQGVTGLRAPTNEPWSIQIGAFTSRAATDPALQSTIKKLPQKFASASPMIAPLKTGDGWLFRGRLSGLTRIQAFEACKHLRECLPVAPQNN